MTLDLQKAGMWRRISAWLFDFILLGILAAGFIFLFSAIFGYDTYLARLEDAYARYEEEYNVNLDITAEDFNNLSDEERARYEAADAAFAIDEEVNYVYSMLLNLSLLMLTFGILFAYIILEFAVPMFFKNGQTIGKKCFGIAVMRSDCIRCTPPLLFIRSILGKYTIETMIPVFIILMIFFGVIGIVGTLVLILILVLQIGIMIATATNSAIHDCLASTVVVDMATQMIFDTEAELLEYKKALHEKEAEAKPY